MRGGAEKGHQIRGDYEICGELLERSLDLYSLQLTLVLWLSFCRHSAFKNAISFFFFFLSRLSAWRSSQARDQTRTAAVTQATAVTTLGP